MANEIGLQASQLLNYASSGGGGVYLSGFAEAIFATSMHPTFPKACQIGQRATAAVHREDRALDQYQPSQDGCPSKTTLGGSNGNRHDASGEEEPNRRVQELYPHQDGDSRSGFH